MDVPAWVDTSLRLYVMDRIDPGGFLKAVLSNDLFGAASMADPVSSDALAAIVAKVVATVPTALCGSRDRVDAWLHDYE